MLLSWRSPPARWRPLAGTALGVVLAHALLLGGVSRPVSPPLGLAGAGPARPVVQLLALPQLTSPVAAAPAAVPAQPQAGGRDDLAVQRAQDAAARAAAAAATSATATGSTTAATATAATTGADTRTAVPPAHGRPTPATRSAGAGPLADRPGAAPPPPAGPPDTTVAAAPGPSLSVAGLADSPPAAAGDDDEAAPARVDAAPAPPGEPPPIYPARPPPAATLRYALLYGGRSGEAVLIWRPTADQYRLQLQGLASVGEAGPPAPARARQDRPLIEQTSQGQLGAQGLGPDRFTDRRQRGSQRAANFRPGLGRIEFSGPASTQPAWAGAQDRLSWWVQLPAIVAAAASVPAEVSLFVVDARGRGELLRLVFVGWVPPPGGAGAGPVQHWRHEPTLPEGQRIEAWLDPAQGHWPVQLRFTALQRGVRFELRLLAIDRPAP